MLLADNLKQHPNQAVAAIGKYLNQLHKWYRSINDNEQQLEEKIKSLEEVHSYFSSWFHNPAFSEHCVTKNFMMALQITLNSFQKLCPDYESIYGCKLQISSIFQDIVVENSFSIIHRKCHYQYLWLYEVYEQSGWMELVK